MNATEPAPILVLGAGSWGTALAILLAENGAPTRLWGRRPEHIRELQLSHRNQRYLPEAEFPLGLEPVCRLQEGLRDCTEVLVAVPTKGLREVLRQLHDCQMDGLRLSWACKGLEHGTRKFPHQVLAEELGDGFPSAVISGPTFAAEVAAGLPTAVTVASADPDYAAALAGRLHGGAFRAYTSADVIGVEIGGAVKNVLAIAAGIADGLGFGANTRAALITRGLAEMMRFGTALGARRETFMGLAGIGDLALTCTDDQSRNRRFGLALARGLDPQRAVAEIGQAVEGVKTAPEVVALAASAGVEMPISEQVAAVIAGKLSPEEAVTALLQREPKEELA